MGQERGSAKSLVEVRTEQKVWTLSTSRIALEPVVLRHKAVVPKSNRAVLF